MDKLADMEATQENADKAIKAFIGALSILIGFGWEKTFDLAVVQITKSSTKVIDEYGLCAPVFKLVLSILVCAIVIPAWRMYILPYIHELEEDVENEEEQAKEISEHENNIKSAP